MLAGGEHAGQTMRAVPALLLLGLAAPPPVATFVIAPPWADEDANPCSQASWQLVYWPPTRDCYQIFSRGPCPETQELGFNPVSQQPECGCPAGLPLHWPATDRCYAQHSRGPCDAGEFLVGGTAGPACVAAERCEPGRAFWPADSTCYQLYTRGPCHKAAEPHPAPLHTSLLLQPHVCTTLLSTPH